MFLTDHNKDILSEQIGRLGGLAVSMLAEYTKDEASHPDTYPAGYMQGYAHACDAAISIIQHCEDIADGQAR